MEFAILSPVAGLKRYASLSHTHLLLPQLDKLPGYRDFYLSMQERGDTLILDNGAYEGKDDWQDVVNCIGIYRPNVVALPDYLLQSWDKTVTASLTFLDRYYDRFPWVKWMFVPQSKPTDIIGWVYGLETAMRDDRISYVGLPRALTYAITNDLMMRCSCAKTVHSLFPNVKIHALGMAKGSLEELNHLKRLGCVSSIDSNAPVWRGWNGWDLSVPVKYTRNQPPESWPEIPCDYESVIPISCTERGQEEGVHGAHQLILHNLEACGVDTTSARNGSIPRGQEVSRG